LKINFNKEAQNLSTTITTLQGVPSGPTNVGLNPAMVLQTSALADAGVKL
jgi:hypothetical protein